MSLIMTACLELWQHVFSFHGSTTNLIKCLLNDFCLEEMGWHLLVILSEHAGIQRDTSMYQPSNLYQLSDNKVINHAKKLMRILVGYNGHQHSESCVVRGPTIATPSFIVVCLFFLQYCWFMNVDVPVTIDVGHCNLYQSIICQFQPLLNHHLQSTMVL